MDGTAGIRWQERVDKHNPIRDVVFADAKNCRVNILEWAREKDFDFEAAPVEFVDQQALSVAA